MKKKSSIRTWIIMIILAAAVLTGYFVLSHRRSTEPVQQETVQTEVTRLLDKNMETDYPATARETVKLYCRFLRCLYKDDMTEQQLEQLAVQLRMLFDDELLAENTDAEYLRKLKKEISEYKDNKRSITGYEVEKADSIISWKEEEYEYARMLAVISVKENTTPLRICEEFLLRRTDSGKWKILGWRLADVNDMDTD